MSAPHIILDNLPSLCQKLSDLIEVWRSYNKNNFACFLRHGVYCQQQRCSPITLVSANIRFVPIFEGVHWREGVKRQGGNRKHGFSRLSTLRLQHVKKWGQRYYVLFSPFHWPRNIWPWLTLNGLNVHYALQYCNLPSGNFLLTYLL